MNAQETQIIQTLKDRVSSIIFRLAQLKQENAELRDTIEQRDAALSAYETKYAELERNYNNLKTGRMLEIGDKDLTAAKNRVNRLVREVDKCIAAVKGLGPDAEQSE